MINAPYFFWLAGANTYTPPDANSEILLTALPETLIVVAEPNWVQFPFLNIDPEKEDWSEGSIIQAQVYNPASHAFIVPAETAELDKILAVFRHRYLYLCMDGKIEVEGTPGTYADQPSATKYVERLHAVGSCICVEKESHKFRFEHKTGSRYIDLKLRKKKPII